MTDTLPGRLAWLQGRVQELLTQFQVPGMCVGVLHQRERHIVAAGVTHVDLGYPVLADTVFQIGSNTKLLTATAAMRAYERGQLDLDAPVERYLPSFTLADAGAAKSITVRHLLTHTSGIDGDHMGPPGHGFSDDMVARCVESLASVGLLHEPGTKWSYCNAGWVVLGRVLEVLAGAPYHELMRDDVFVPLGMAHTFVLPQHILAGSAAMGHLPSSPDTPPRPAPVYATAPGCAPAGSVPVSSADDLLTFLQMHMDGGRAADATPYLSPAAVTAMQQPQFPIPPTGHTDAIGLGWMVGRSRGASRVLGHGGGTLGQVCVLETMPDHGLAVVSLSNSFGGGMAGVALVEEVIQACTNDHLAPPKPPVPSGIALDLSRYEGRYRRLGTTVTVSAQPGTLRMVIDEEPMVPEARTAPPEITVAPLDAETFANTASGGLVRFSDFDSDGHPTYLFNFRLLRRSGG